MAGEIDLLNFGEAEPPPRVAFGCVEERKMIPLHTLPTRMGIEQGLRGSPDRGPGRYEPDPVTLFPKPLGSRPHSIRGWYFGASLSKRLPKQTKGIKPGPADYQQVTHKELKPTYKPFGSAASRLPADKRGAGKVGPGTYKHDVPIGKCIEYNSSFGGQRTLRGVVSLKCTKGIPDKCSQCEKEPVGDYYESSGTALCPDCYQKLCTSTPLSEQDALQKFGKVRDCRNVHKHEFPGREPKIIVKTEKELKKARLKEAYLRLYYS